MQTDVRQTESILFCQEAFWPGDAPPRMPHDPNTLCASITLLGRPVSVRAPVRAAMGGVVGFKTVLVFSSDIYERM